VPKNWQAIQVIRAWYPGTWHKRSIT
ncbi:uncharacterized protein METZ01_LOCUS269363, partial [marine metagenome]